MTGIATVTVIVILLVVTVKIYHGRHPAQNQGVHDPDEGLYESLDSENFNTAVVIPSSAEATARKEAHGLTLTQEHEYEYADVCLFKATMTKPALNSGSSSTRPQSSQGNLSTTEDVIATTNSDGDLVGPDDNAMCSGEVSSDQHDLAPHNQSHSARDGTSPPALAQNYEEHQYTSVFQIETANKYTTSTPRGYSSSTEDAFATINSDGDTAIVSPD